MKTSDLYLDIMAKLKAHQRPLLKLTPELIEELSIDWQKALNEPIDKQGLLEILCILDNTQNTSNAFNELFIITFEKCTHSDQLIHALAASQKHLVAQSLKSGVMLPQAYFDCLKNLLKNKNPEVIEWTLRTIEAMGPLSLRLKLEVRAAKPGLTKFFNPHQKSAAQIIELLEKQWERMLL